MWCRLFKPALAKSVPFLTAVATQATIQVFLRHQNQREVFKKPILPLTPLPPTSLLEGPPSYLPRMR